MHFPQVAFGGTASVPPKAIYSGLRQALRDTASQGSRASAVVPAQLLHHEYLSAIGVLFLQFGTVELHAFTDLQRRRLAFQRIHLRVARVQFHSSGAGEEAASKRVVLVFNRARNHHRCYDNRCRQGCDGKADLGLGTRSRSGTNQSSRHREGHNAPTAAGA